jgi:hypothetical protein
MKLASRVAAMQGDAMGRICILTPEPDYEEDWRTPAGQYGALFGDALDFRCWSDAGNLTEFALVLPLLAWGYQRRPARWFAQLDAWEAAGVAMANRIATLRWNTDKDYLLDLEAAGIAIVPTIETHDLGREDLAAARERFGCEVLVVKPSISGGADGTYRLGPGDAIPFDVIEREMLIQPLITSITDEGEYSLFYFDGAFSHAILKKPAAGDFRVQEQFGGREVTINAPAAARALASEVLAAAPGPLLYARVDMVRDKQGAFRLMELEAIEPSLFLDHAADGGTMFADGVRRLIASPRP